MDVSAHLIKLLRESDRERYLSTLYAPANKRTPLMALYAFNAEIAAIRDRVREPMAGEVRLQWWRDVLAVEEVLLTGNPVADALIGAISDYKLPRTAFLRMLDARIFDLYDDPMPDRATLEGYCGETASTLIQLAVMVLEPKSASGWADASGHAGCAQALTGILRLLPIHRARGQCFVPADILAAAGSSADDLISGDDHRKAAGAVLAVAALAREHFATFLAKAGDMPATLRPAFLPLASGHAVLRRIEARPGDALERSQEISLLRSYVQMLVAAMRGLR